MKVKSGMATRAAFAALLSGSLLVGISPSVAHATEPITPYSCPLSGDQYIYSFTNVARSSRPTDLYSAYITGPGTITYSKSTTATVGASMSASVTAEAGIVFAKASATIGVSVEASKSWTDGFSYALDVPSGQRRRMRLFEESRSFNVTKKSWSTGNCAYVVVYGNQAANAPRSTRVDEWKLEA
jgi:hypothetical protein